MLLYFFYNTNLNEVPITISLTTLQWTVKLWKRTLKQIFPEIPNSYIHESVSNLYIPPISPPNLLQQNRWTDGDNIKIAHRYMNMEIGNEAVQFHFWEYINRILFVMRTFGASSWIWHECHSPHTNRPFCLDCYKQCMMRQGHCCLLIICHAWGQKLAVF